MARQVWKLGKFNKGINSHTDPKDIKDSEWAELEDVNISKVGVARPIGMPRIDTSVHQIHVSAIIPGDGLYKFDSDNSYMGSTYTMSFSSLENTLDGGGGQTAKLQFSIKSLVWVFPESSNIVNGYCKFQLFIGSTPITDEFIVYHSDGSPNFYTKIDESADNNIIETNVMANIPNSGSLSAFGYDFDYQTWGDGTSDVGTSPNKISQNSAIIGRILVGGGLTPSSTEAILWGDSNGDEKDWFTNGKSHFSENSSILGFGASLTEPVHPHSHVQWDFGNENQLTNLGDKDLPFSAIYNSEFLPSGALSKNAHEMMGFYKWDGYHQEIQASNGSIMGLLSVDYAFTVPVYMLEPGSHSWQPDEYGIYHSYYMARYSFSARLIKAINEYSGGSENDRFYARFVHDNNEWTLDDYDTSDHEEIVPPTDHDDNSWHVSSQYIDDIYLFSRKKIAKTGDLGCKMTYRSTSGTSISTDGGGSAYSTGVAESVHLLDDRDRYGQGAGDSNIISFTDENGSEILSDFNISSTTDGSTLGPYGGAMVVEGSKTLQSGVSGDVAETWKLTIKGYPTSLNILKLHFYGEGDLVNDLDLQLQANFPGKNGNRDFCAALQVFINTDAGAIAGGYISTSDILIVEGTENYSYPHYSININAVTGGTEGQFNLEQEWVGSDSHSPLYSIGIEDEQMIFMGKGSQSVTLASSTIYPVNFKIFSTFASTWINGFNPSGNITTVYENDMNTFLNWWSDDIYNNEPLFYDEGNVLRIIESNFDLKQSLEFKINQEVVGDNVSNDYAGNMWANPNQWIGYKDISSHFGDVFNYQTRATGFFIGHQSKIWNYTYESNNDLYGMRAASTTAGTDQGTADNFSAEKAFMQFHFSSNSSGGVDWTGHIKIYAAVVYDDNSESLPQHYFNDALTGAGGYFDDDNNAKTLKFTMLFKPISDNEKLAFPDLRITGIRLYYTHSEENHSTFWNLGKFDFNRGFLKASTIDVTDNTSGLDVKYEWAKANGATYADDSDFNTLLSDEVLTVHNGSTLVIEYTEMPKTKSYEDINGFSPYARTLSVDYKSACIAGRRTFAGNIRVWNGQVWEYYNDRMVISPINALDTFPYPDNVLDLDISDGDSIIALAPFDDKVIQFKTKICYILNISTGIASEFFIEERHKWKGISNRHHFCLTDKGIFWVNNRGAWIYNGEDIEDLFMREDGDDSQQLIDKDEWSSFISNKSLVGYDANTRQVMIVKSHTYSTAGDSDCYIYSLIVKAWTKGIKRFYPGENNSITNFQNIGEFGKLCYLSEESNNGGGPDNPGEIL